MRPSAAAGSLARPCATCSARLAAMKSRAAASCAAALSVNLTCQPARANTIDHARPMRPAPITAIVLSMSSHPQYLATQFEIGAQRGCCTLVHNAAPFQHVGAIGQRQHQIEIMLDNH